MTRTIVTLYNPVQAYQVLKDVWQNIKPMLIAGHRLVLEVRPETRSLSQNARLWAILTDVSEQVEWYGRKLTPDDWKHVFTAALSKQDAVPGIEGGFVVLGKATSKMTKSEMAELQTLIEAFGVQRGVKFTAPDWVEE